MKELSSGTAPGGITRKLAALATLTPINCVPKRLLPTAQRPPDGLARLSGVQYTGIIRSRLPGPFMFRNRWVRRIAIGFGVSVVAAIAFAIYHRYATFTAGEERLASVVADLDASDPRWRYADIESARGHLADDENSALLVPKFTSALATPKLEATRTNGQHLVFDSPPNRWLDDDAYAAIDRALDRNRAALAVARSFKDRSRGLRHLNVSP